MNLRSVLPALIAALTPFLVAITQPLKGLIVSNPIASAVVGSLGAVVLALLPPPNAPKSAPCPVCDAREKTKELNP